VGAIEVWWGQDRMSEGPRDAKWLVVGSGGMLGTDVMLALAGRDATGLGHAQLDIAVADWVAEVVNGFDVVVNCAAFTGVDAAESAELEAFAVNAVGPANLARACAIAGARLLHISTDYVFSGDATSPYSEDSHLAPRSAYGRTKAAGEWAVRAELPAGAYILRTAWLYGAKGASFVRTMAELAAGSDPVNVVADQQGQPTWSADVAVRIVEMVEAGLPVGTYHATASGSTTWYELARRVFELAGADVHRVRPTTSSGFVRAAARPAFSVLGHDGWLKSGLPPMRDWRLALATAWPELLVEASAASPDTGDKASRR
jgi:dTDP-4-dehydrorhamnose reductase